MFKKNKVFEDPDPCQNKNVSGSVLKCTRSADCVQVYLNRTLVPTICRKVSTGTVLCIRYLGTGANVGTLFLK